MRRLWRLQGKVRTDGIYLFHRCPDLDAVDQSWWLDEKTYRKAPGCFPTFPYQSRFPDVSDHFSDHFPQPTTPKSAPGEGSGITTEIVAASNFEGPLAPFLLRGGLPSAVPGQTWSQAVLQRPASAGGYGKYGLHVVLQNHHLQWAKKNMGNLWDNCEKSWEIMVEECGRMLKPFKTI